MIRAFFMDIGKRSTYFKNNSPRSWKGIKGEVRNKIYTLFFYCQYSNRVVYRL